MDFWNSQFPGQIVNDIILPSVIDDHALTLEGHQIRFVEAGDSDTQDTTFVHVPELDLVVAGDIVYNGVHLFLAGGDAKRRRDWIAAIDKIAALSPKVVIAGHKAPGSDDGPEHLDETRRYLMDVEELGHTTRNAKDFADLMAPRHLSRVNPNFLFQSAEHLFPGTRVA
jgi:hypothetical protein